MGDSFDVKYSLLPLDLQFKLWVLALDANTSRVNLAYQSGAFRSGLEYNYGGSFDASLTIRRYTMKVAVNPNSGDATVDLGLQFKGFNFAGSANLTRRAAGLGITYGSDIVPFPDELETAFTRANTGLLRMARDAPSAPANPLEWYRLHSDDANAISGAVKAGRQIVNLKKNSDNFGTALRLNYTPQSGLTIYGVLQYTF